MLSYKKVIEKKEISCKHSSNDDSNEYIHFDDRSKYSYEETDDKKVNFTYYVLLNHCVLNDINIYVPLRSKITPKLDNSLKRENVKSICSNVFFLFLSLRKLGKTVFLKTFTQTAQKKIQQPKLLETVKS